MIIYTPWPMEELFGTMGQQVSYRELQMGSAKLLVEQTTADKCRVVRLLSTDPQDYLRPDFQPGTELTLDPAVKREEI